MNITKEIYLDQDSGVLMYQDADGNWKPVHTSAQLDGNRVRLTPEGYLEFKDFVDDVWKQMVDADGNPISLKGVKGDKGDKGDTGEKGKDGDNTEDMNASYHLELSNDMDLVYVNADNTVSVEQTLSSRITLYKDGELNSGDLEDSDSKWVFTIANLDILTAAGLPEASIDNSRFSITFNSQTAIDLNTFVYQIQATLVDKNTELALVLLYKDFKVVRIQGTVDYDLQVSPQVLKISSDGTTAEGTAISVKIKKKAVGMSSDVQLISPNDLQDPYEVKYKWGNNSEASLNTDTITPNENLSPADKLTISLYYGDTVVDTAYVECVRDGLDGKTDKHIELSNDFDQIYVVDGKAKCDFEYPVSITYYEGADQLKFSSSGDITIEDSRYYSILEKTISGDSKTITFTIKVPAGQDFSGVSGALQIPIYLGDQGMSRAKNFTLAVLTGEYDYDLYVTPDVIRRTQNELGNWVYDNSQFTVKLYQSTIGAKGETPKEITYLPENYSLKWFVDGVELSGEGNKIKLGTNYVPTSDTGAYKKITVNLYYTESDNESTLVDWVELAILSDGAKGEKGNDGASAYFIDLDNDADQLYYSDDFNVYAGLTFETIMTLYKGTDILNIQAHEVTVTPSVEGINTVEKETISIGEGDEKIERVKVIVKFNDDIDINKIKDLKNITYTLTYNGTVLDEGKSSPLTLSKLARVVVILGQDDFDIQLSQTCLCKTGSGELQPSQKPITVTVLHKEFKGQKTSHSPITNLEYLSTYDLSIRYSIDGSAERLISPLEQINTSILKQAENYVMVYLAKGLDIIDYARIDVIYDGADGKDASGWVVDLSNDQDQVYHLDGKTLVELVLTTEIRVFDNSKQLSTEKYTVDYILPPAIENYVDSDKITCVSHENYYRFTLTIPEGEQCVSGLDTLQIQFEVTVADENIYLAKAWNLRVLEGTEDFDLQLSRLTVKSSGTAILDVSDLMVWVKKTALGGGGGASKVNVYANSDADDETWNKYGLSVEAKAFTGANETVSNIGIDENGCLNLNQTVAACDHIVVTLKKDDIPYDDEIILIVKNGDSYHLEIENEYDLVYILGGKTLQQDPLTLGTITLYNGATVIPNEDFVLSWEESSSDDISFQTRRNDDDSWSASVTYNEGVSALSTQTYILVASTVDENDNAGTRLAASKFTVIPIADSVDYDLRINKTVLNKGTNTTLSNANIVVNVYKKDLSTSTGDTLDYSGWTEEGLSVNISVDGKSETNVTSSEYTIDSITNYAELKLYKNRQLRDSVRIEVVSDGQPGDPGNDGPAAKQLVCTSGNTHTFYLNDKGQALQKDLTWTPTFAFLNGNTLTSVTPTNLTCTSSLTYKPSCDQNTITVSHSTAYLSGTYSLTATYKDEDNNSYTCNLTAVLVNGDKSYDLLTSPSQIKLDNTSTEYPTITLEAKKKIKGGSYYEISNVSLNGETTDELHFMVNSGKDGADEDIKWDADTESYSYTPTSDALIVIKAVDNTAALVDFQIISVIRDGAGIDTVIPTNPDLGDVINYGEKIWKNNVPLYPLVYGGTYSYICDPLTGLFPSTVCCIVPTVMIERPENYNGLDSGHGTNPIPILKANDRVSTVIPWGTGDTYLEIEKNTNGLRDALDLQRFVFLALVALQANGQYRTDDGLNMIMSPIFKVQFKIGGNTAKYVVKTSVKIATGSLVLPVYKLNLSELGTLLFELSYNYQSSPFTMALKELSKASSYTDGIVPQTFLMYILFLQCDKSYGSQISLYTEHAHYLSLVIKAIAGDSADAAWILTTVPNMPEGWKIGVRTSTTVIDSNLDNSQT